MDETKTGRVQGDSGSTLRRIPRRRPPRDRWRQAFGPSRRTDTAVLGRVTQSTGPPTGRVHRASAQERRLRAKTASGGRKLDVCGIRGMRDVCGAFDAWRHHER